MQSTCPKCRLHLKFLECFLFKPSRHMGQLAVSESFDRFSSSASVNRSSVRFFSILFRSWILLLTELTAGVRFGGKFWSSILLTGVLSAMSTIEFSFEIWDRSCLSELWATARLSDVAIVSSCCAFSGQLLLINLLLSWNSWSLSDWGIFWWERSLIAPLASLNHKVNYDSANQNGAADQNGDYDCWWPYRRPTSDFQDWL